MYQGNWELLRELSGHLCLMWSSRVTASERDVVLLVREGFKRPEGRPEFKCLDCERTDGLMLIPEPGSQELANKIDYQWLCVPCYNYRCDSV